MRAVTSAMSSTVQMANLAEVSPFFCFLMLSSSSSAVSFSAWKRETHLHYQPCARRLVCLRGFLTCIGKRRVCRVSSSPQLRSPQKCREFCALHSPSRYQKPRKHSNEQTRRFILGSECFETLQHLVPTPTPFPCSCPFSLY